MASEVSLQGMKKAVFFPFRGKNSTDKILIGAAIYFANFIIPLIPFILLLDYFGQIMKRIIVLDLDPQMPEWNDWGTFFIDGLRIFGALVIYTLPGVLVMIFGYFLIFGTSFVMSFLGSFFTLAFSNGNAPSPLPIFFTTLTSIVGSLAGFLIIWIGLIISLISGVFYQPAMGHLIARGDFGAAFRFKEWWPVFKANLGGYLLTTIFALGFVIFLSFFIQFLYLTVVLCILLPFVISILGFIIESAVYSLYAIAYRDGVRQLTGKAV